VAGILLIVTSLLSFPSVSEVYIGVDANYTNHSVTKLEKEVFNNYPKMLQPGLTVIAESGAVSPKISIGVICDKGWVLEVSHTRPQTITIGGTLEGKFWLGDMADSIPRGVDVYGLGYTLQNIGLGKESWGSDLRKLIHKREQSGHNDLYMRQKFTSIKDYRYTGEYTYRASSIKIGRQYDGEVSSIGFLLGPKFVKTSVKESISYKGKVSQPNYSLVRSSEDVHWELSANLKVKVSEKVALKYELHGTPDEGAVGINAGIEVKL